MIVYILHAVGYMIYIIYYMHITTKKSNHHKGLVGHLSHPKEWNHGNQCQTGELGSKGKRCQRQFAWPVVMFET